MRNKWIKWLFPIFALLLLLPWPVAFAASINDEAGEDTVQIEIAEDSAKPSYKVLGKAIGGVGSGDLFYIDAASNAADILTTVYITNAEELIGHYTFVILKVGVYVKNNGEWEKASGSNGELIPDTVLSMRNGQVSFLLPGYAKYKITIDSGCFYCHNANADDGGISPQLYLEVD